MEQKVRDRAEKNKNPGKINKGFIRKNKKLGGIGTIWVRIRRETKKIRAVVIR